MTSALPILVTGSHRSGTTWVGRILAASPSFAYVHEPFHVRGDAANGLRFDRWFTYICGENGPCYRDAVAGILDRARHGGGDGRPAERRPILKDPLAVFSAPWLASTFQMRVVVMIRHPAAFAGSLKERGWRHPFADFLNQPLLMRDHLWPFAAELLQFARVERDIVDQAALLWALIYTAVAGFRDDYPGWIFLRHEDLARDPSAGFQALADQLDIELSPDMERAIAETASSANLDAWKTRLTSAEIDRVRSRVEDVSRRFYADREW